MYFLHKNWWFSYIMGPQWVGFTKKSRHKKDWSKISIAFLEKSPNYGNLSLVPWIKCSTNHSWKIFFLKNLSSYWLIQVSWILNSTCKKCTKRGDSWRAKRWVSSFRELSMILLGGLVKWFWPQHFICFFLRKNIWRNHKNVQLIRHTMGTMLWDWTGPTFEHLGVNQSLVKVITFL